MNGDQKTGTLADLLNRNWWLLALRGLAGVVFAVIAFAWPGITLIALIFLFGGYAIVSGILAFVAAARAPKGYPRFGSLIFEGIMSIIAGVLAFFVPGITALALVLLIAAWAIVTGIMEIVSAIRLRKVIRNEWLLVLAGLASLALGALLVLAPGAGALAMVFWIAAFTLVSSVLLIVLAFRLRRWTRAAAPSPA